MKNSMTITKTAGTIIGTAKRSFLNTNKGKLPVLKGSKLEWYMVKRLMESKFVSISFSLTEMASFEEAVSYFKETFSEITDETREDGFGLDFLYHNLENGIGIEQIYLKNA